MISYCRAKWIMIAVLCLGIVAGFPLLSNLSFADKSEERIESNEQYLREDILKSITFVYRGMNAGLKAELTPKGNSKTVYAINGELKKQYLAVTSSRKVKINHTYSTLRLGNKIDINLIGFYKISAGIDLSTVEYEFQGDMILVRGAEPVLISCERLALEDLDKSNGWWNNVKDEDKIAAQFALDSVAREHAAINNELLPEAKNRFLEKLQHGLDKKYSTYRFITDPS